MPETRINSAEASNLSNAIPEVTVDTAQTNGANGDSETRYQIQNFAQNLGYYKQIPELRAVIDAKSTWTIGKGFKSDPETTFILDSIKGFGKDSFNTILENLLRTMHIAGDAFAEIIRDEENNLINVKTLDPGTMVIVVNKQGLIKGYEQVSKNSSEKGTTKKFKPEEIFHLTRNRVADEIHGTSMIDTLEWIILAKKEVQEIFKTVMQRHIKPVMIFHLDTDDTTEIAAFKIKMDKAYADGENMYIPKDVVVPEVLSVAPNATLNPMIWLEYLNKQFYQTAGVPQIIVGGSSEFVEKATSIVYLAYQQNVEEDQLYMEEQMGMQLGIELELEFPVSLENELLSDESKDGNESMQPNEAGVGQAQ